MLYQPLNCDAVTFHIQLQLLLQTQGVIMEEGASQKYYLKTQHGELTLHPIISPIERSECGTAGTPDSPSTFSMRITK